ncbi:MAG TPA: adenylosuccinate lyase [Acidimicrobiia bacterium]|jgi:adenylosuccinate lyase|nr:adenylosuccinate lyase [Acidimicrobiia bacterium]
MIERYSLPEMTSIWAEPHKLEVWKEVETLVVEAWVEEGVAPAEAAVAARRAPEVDAAEWKSREQVTNHDVAAFVDVLAASVTEGGEWIHYGLTSSDVLDTAQGVILREAAELLLNRLVALHDVVRQRAFEHRDTVMIGRTHGIWAEPTTFGLKLANWAFELQRDVQRLERARDAVAVGKISGAVGTYAHTPPSIEAFVCGRLGIAVEPASSQITHRDRHAEYLSTLALIGATLERFATEIRHLQRSEVGEVLESFEKGQKGSSAMPHKRNPIASENLTGVARLLRGYAGAGLEDVALWHERDISHSSVERVALPDASILLDYALVRMTRLVDNLVVNADQMAANLDRTRGLVFSQAVLLALVEHGMTRDEAYRLVQRNAMKAWEDGVPLQRLLESDPDVSLEASDLAECFSPARFLRHIGVVFQRLEASKINGSVHRPDV